jgi:hypothetical protein
MSREMSFKQRLDAGWSMVELMKYYAMTKCEYDRVVACLADIKKNRGKA